MDEKLKKMLVALNCGGDAYEARCNAKRSEANDEIDTLKNELESKGRELAVVQADAEDSRKKHADEMRMLRAQHKHTMDHTQRVHVAELQRTQHLMAEMK